ncbi:MAG: hypothetical protein CVV21_02425 [Candidatus Goldiibacteriota bacterium HGW-Goldbacteria-1]|jgi:F-type H+-transporting ATPase subunit b|nr:MAG: hypothetical protein CVV21_02425 [Candidatus Goldiibacteriota bacterium HGW-Goldbacteria-1]
MHFDLFTFIAQLINFALLVFLLNKFLFGRIKAAMDEREKKIAGDLEKAGILREEAQKSAALAAEELKLLESRRQEMLDNARKKAREEAEEMKAAAQGAQREQQKKWQQAFSGEQENYLRMLKAHSGKFAWKVSEKMLRELSDEKINDKAAEIFLKKLEALGGAQTAEFKAAVNRSEKPVVVSSPFIIDAGIKDKISGVIAAKTGSQKTVIYELNEALVCGIEAGAEGYKISWGGEEYFSGIEKEVMDVFKDGSKKGGYDG